MSVITKNFTLETKGHTQILDITQKVKGIMADSPLSSGIAVVFVPGSTAGITSIEYESGVVQDLAEAIERLAPRSIHYKHDARWGDGNGYAHVRAALMGASFTVPFRNKQLLLGTWQQIVLIDFDNRPRSRDIIVQLMGE
ncbi:MAG: secondary thiamine-phosphate synthase enzyme YjbQ [bacterium]